MLVKFYNKIMKPSFCIYSYNSQSSFCIYNYNPRGNVRLALASCRTAPEANCEAHS